MKKKSNRINTIKNCIYMLKIVCKEKKGYFYLFCKIIYSIYLVLPRIINLVIPGLIINELTIGESNLNNIIILVGILVASPIIDKIIRRLVEFNLYKVKLNLQIVYDTEYNNYLMNMDYENFEYPEFEDKLYRAELCSDSRLVIVDKLCNLLYSFISLFAIFSILASLNLLIVLVIILIIFINALITKRFNRNQYKYNKEMTRYSRYINNMKNIASLPWHAAEIRNFDMGPYVTEIINTKQRESNKIMYKHSLNWQNSQLLYAVTNFFQQGFSYAYLIYKVLKNQISIGNMTIFLSAITQFSSLFDSLVKSYLALEKDAMEIAEFKYVMELPSKQMTIGDKIPSISADSKIEFRNVYFKYPNCDEYALENINITFNMKEKVCLVGTNGSGKTTLIKLLLRLYFPTSGEILLDGININEFDFKAYQLLFSPVLQDYSLYPTTLKENIAFDLNPDYKKLDKVCDEVKLTKKIESLKKGYDTYIWKMYDEDGFVPSGGEGQRIAIARALYHERPIYLLDEPTASLDPIAENEIYEQFSKIIKNHFALMISHRLSIVKLTNKVMVLNKAKLVGYDTHENLYMNNEFYRNMFDVQAKFYQKKNNEE